VEPKTKLEVGLVGRDGEHRKRGTFFANVIRATESNAGKTVVTLESTEYGNVTCELLLKNYWITSIQVTFSDTYGSFEEFYQENQEDLNEAFETIVEIMRNDGGHIESHTTESRVTKEESTMQGPKRIEVALRRNGNSQEETRVVVTSVIRPGGQHHHSTIAGRSWKGKGTKLPRSIEHFPSYNYWIKEIVLFAGGSTGTSAKFNYSKHTDSLAWSQLETSYSGFKQSELTVVRNWEPDSKNPYSSKYSVYNGQVYEDDDLGIYGFAQVHYSQRVPENYQPSVGFFRVSGDEIGAELFRKQRVSQNDVVVGLKELIEKEDSLERGVREKKQQATALLPATIQKPKQSENVSRNNKEESHSGTPIDVQYCDCGNPLCEDCAWANALKHNSAQTNKTIH